MPRAFSVKDRISRTLDMFEKARTWPVLGRREGDDLNRAVVVTASEASGCERRLFYEKRAPHRRDEETSGDKGFAYRGDAIESWIVDVLEQGLHEHEQLVLHGMMQRSLVLGNVSGTPDGWFIDFKEGTIRVLEVKSFDPRANPANFPKPGHVLQAKINDALLRTFKRNRVAFEELTGISLGKLRFAPPHLIYVNSNNALDIHEFDITPDDTALDLADHKHSRVMAASRAVNLDPQGLVTGECTYCAFKEACKKDGVPTKDGIVDRRLPEFAPRGIGNELRVYHEAKAQADALKKKLEAASESIKLKMMQNAKDTLEAGGYVAKVTKAKGRKSLDVEAYEAATGVSPDPFYKTGKPSIRLEVSKLDK